MKSLNFEYNLYSFVLKLNLDSLNYSLDFGQYTT